jgi:hypothetical protein
MTDKDKILVTFVLGLVYSGEDITFTGDVATFKRKGKTISMLVQRLAQDNNNFLFNKATLGKHEYTMQMSDTYIRMFSVKKVRELLEANVKHLVSSGTNREVDFQIIKGVITEYKWEDLK